MILVHPLVYLRTRNKNFFSCRRVLRIESSSWHLLLHVYPILYSYFTYTTPPHIGSNSSSSLGPFELPSPSFVVFLPSFLPRPPPSQDQVSSLHSTSHTPLNLLDSYSGPRSTHHLVSTVNLFGTDEDNPESYTRLFKLKIGPPKPLCILKFDPWLSRSRQNVSNETDMIHYIYLLILFREQ